MPQRAEPRAELEPLFSWARAAGMEPMDLSEMWRGQDVASLQVAPWDRHPNAAGHRLIADRVYELLSAPGVLERPSASANSTDTTQPNSPELAGAAPGKEGK